MYTGAFSSDKSISKNDSLLQFSSLALLKAGVGNSGCVNIEGVQKKLFHSDRFDHRPSKTGRKGAFGENAYREENVSQISTTNMNLKTRVLEKHKALTVRHKGGGST